MELEREVTKKHTKELAKTWTEAVATVTNKANISEALKQSGIYATEGYARGLLDPKAIQKVKESAQTMVQAAIDAANLTQKTGSPARVFRDDVAYWGGAGYALGLTDSQGLIKKSAQAMVQCAIDEAKQMNPLLEDAFSIDLGSTIDGMRSIAIQHSSTMPVQASNDVYNSYATNMDPIDYDKLGKSVAGAIGDEGLSVKLNSREIGRMKKEWQ